MTVAKGRPGRHHTSRDVLDTSSNEVVLSATLAHIRAMAAFVVVVAFTVVILDGIVLAVFRAGVRRQQAAGSLTSQPASLSAALIRRIVGLAAEPPRHRGRAGQAQSRSSAPALRP